jgi:hypothetical protein
MFDPSLVFALLYVGAELLADGSPATCQGRCWAGVPGRGRNALAGQKHGSRRRPTERLASYVWFVDGNDYSKELKFFAVRARVQQQMAHARRKVQ